MGDKPKKPRRVTTKRVQAEENKPFIPKVDVKPEIDTDDCGDDGLTVKQRLFVAALAGPARGNATKAAELAGYRADNRHAIEQTAYENLRKPEVQEAIALALAKKCAGADWARATLIDLARSSMSNFVSVDAEGKPELDFAKASAAGAIGHIKEFSADVLPGHDGGPGEVIRCKIKVHDRTAALVALLKMHGIISERHEHGGIGGGPIAHDHALTLDIRKFSDEQINVLQRMIEDANRRSAGLARSDSRN